MKPIDDINEKFNNYCPKLGRKLCTFTLGVENISYFCTIENNGFEPRMATEPCTIEDSKMCRMMQYKKQLKELE